MLLLVARLKCGKGNGEYDLYFQVTGDMCLSNFELVFPSR